MKVSEVKAEQSTATVILEAEHPAEIALLNLLTGCEANCQIQDPPKDGEGQKLSVLVTVKKSRY